MGLFNTLKISYSGLSTAQTGITTTGHNISNANTEGYSRQIISQKVNYPIHNIPGDVGNGVQIDYIKRAHDEFIYSKFRDSNSNMEFNKFSKQILEEINGYFPDLEDLGIAKEFKEFFNSWSNLAQNPNSNAQKSILAQNITNLTSTLQDTKSQLQNMQNRLNEQLHTYIDEANQIAKDITNLNKEINRVEADGISHANDLRDQRDLLELSLAKLLNITVFKGKMKSDNLDNITDQGKEYNVSIGGYNFIDGTSFRELSADTILNEGRFDNVYFIDENFQKNDITQYIRGGKIGALLDLRGNQFDQTTKLPTNGKIQKYIDNLDLLSKTFIQNINSIYASSPQSSITTDEFINFDADDKLINYDNIQIGSFNIVVYDQNGNEILKRAINIDENTALDDGSANSIVSQINANIDDNSDNNGVNDLDDLFSASFISGKLNILPKDSSLGYQIAIEDNNTNFAGVTGINKLLTGDSADSIDLNTKYKNDPSLISAAKKPVVGNNEVATAILDLQYKEISFYKNSDTVYKNTIEGFYNFSVTILTSDTQQANRNYDAAEVLNKTVKQELDSIKGVNIDEELVNLIKYQTAYSANAKVITAIDKMLDTLLAIR